MLSQTQCSVRHNAQSDTMLSQTQHPSRHNAQSDTMLSQTGNNQTSMFIYILSHSHCAAKAKRKMSKRVEKATFHGLSKTFFVQTQKLD